MSPELGEPTNLNKQQQAVLKSNSEVFARTGILDRYIAVHASLREFARAFSSKAARIDIIDYVINSNFPLAIATRQDGEESSFWLVKVEDNGEVLFGSGILLSTVVNGIETPLEDLGLSQDQRTVIQQLYLNQDDANLHIHAENL